MNARTHAHAHTQCFCWEMTKVSPACWQRERERQGSLWGSPGFVKLSASHLGSRGDGALHNLEWPLFAPCRRYLPSRVIRNDNRQRGAEVHPPYPLPLAAGIRASGSCSSNPSSSSFAIFFKKWNGDFFFVSFSQVYLPSSSSLLFPSSRNSTLLSLSPFPSSSLYCLSLTSARACTHAC